MPASSVLKASGPALLLCLDAAAFAAPMPSRFESTQSRGGGRSQWSLRQRQGAERNGSVTLPIGAREVKDVAYGSDPNQALDVYIPRIADNAPIIFMVHGGGWRRGDKANFNVVQNKVDYFLSRGFIFVSANYRMVPQVGVMTEAADVASALAYVQQHAASSGGDSSRLVAMGHSAGAHLMMLVTSVPSMRQAAGVKAWRATIALDSGGYNIVQIMSEPHPRLYDPVFGNDPELWKEASPTLQLKSTPAVPILLVCSTMRASSCDQATAYANKADRLGGHVEVAPTALRHQQLNADAGLPGQYTSRIESFIDALGIH